MADPSGPGDETPVDNAEEQDRVPGDWQDVKRYLLALLGLVLLGILMMAAVAVYEYRHYSGAKAEDTRPIPADEDVMRQGSVPERLRKVHGMQKAQPSAAPSASSAR